MRERGGKEKGNRREKKKKKGGGGKSHKAHTRKRKRKRRKRGMKSQTSWGRTNVVTLGPQFTVNVNTEYRPNRVHFAPRLSLVRNGRHANASRKHARAIKTNPLTCSHFVPLVVSACSARKTAGMPTSVAMQSSRAKILRL